MQLDEYLKTIDTCEAADLAERLAKLLRGAVYVAPEATMGRLIHPAVDLLNGIACALQIDLIDSKDAL